MDLVLPCPWAGPTSAVSLLCKDVSWQERIDQAVVRQRGGAHRRKETYPGLGVVGPIGPLAVDLNWQRASAKLTRS